MKEVFSIFDIWSGLSEAAKAEGINYLHGLVAHGRSQAPSPEAMGQAQAQGTEIPRLP